ncbi:universal stress protein [Actinoplanes sp. L3-i22]|nr:universal stress protein [Actinoplanes sp. L3-i22]
MLERLAGTEPVHPVVAGVSRSAASRRAVEAAAAEAAARGCPLRLVHAFSWLPDLAEHQWSSAELLRQAKALAAAAAPGLRITTELIEGHPVTGLLRLSRRAGLTVIGDGDLNDRVCLPRDATAVQLAARAFGTVMVTRAACPPAGPVLVGINGAADSEQVLRLAVEEAARQDTDLIVVHVGEIGERAHAVEAMVTGLALDHRVGLRFRVLTGDPTEVLREEARDASLIVVGARGEMPYHGLLGSVAQTLLHHGRGPVVVVRRARPVAARDMRVGVVSEGGTR